MTFPQEADLAPHRGRMAARRADYLVGTIQFLAFLKTYGLGPLENFSRDEFSASRSYEIPAGSLDERKAQADEIARKLGAVPQWRNGYYMAVLQDAILRTEIHFFPQILVPGDEAGKAA